MAEGENEKSTEKRGKKPRQRKKHLFKSILEQMEFYFSDSNLSKDRFLSQLISKDPYVDLEVFLKFNKIRKLGCSIDEIRKAMSKSELIELSEDSLKVRRKKPLKAKQNVDECTVYVENIPTEADHDWVKQKFADLGNVVYISIPKYKHNRMNKGFAFVEFETEDEANTAVDFFENIGCKISLDKDPEELKSIATFEGNTEQDVLVEKKKGEDDKKIKQKEEECTDEQKSEIKEEKIKQEKTDEMEVETEQNGKKRKQKAENFETDTNVKKEECTDEENTETKIEVKVEREGKKRKLSTEEEIKSEKRVKKEEMSTNIDEKEKEPEVKKKNKKKEKKKSQMKELGLQVLSKKEWKKIRNRYLDLQKKKMKEFKQYLNKQKYSKPNYDENNQHFEETEEPKENEDETSYKKIEFTPGVIVKVKLPEPCSDIKKIKNDLKAVNPNVKYIDVPLPAGSEEIFVRFGNNESAKEFCGQDFPGEKVLLEHNEETEYWQKIENDRKLKCAKASKKQRGRDRLLKKAEKERANHIRFEETEALS